MMGPMKLAAIRKELRKAYGMTDAQLTAWFNERMKQAAEKPRAEPTEIESLRLLRDALVEEVKKNKPKRAPRAGASKAG